MTDPPKTLKLPVVKGQTFRNKTVVLDGTRYEECNFAECTIVYSGGAADLSACVFTPNTKWDFRNSAALTIQTLRLAGWRLEFGKPGPDSGAIQIG